MKTRIMAIDPGKSGGIAYSLMDRDGSEHVVTHHMPDTPGDMLDLITAVTTDVCQGSQWTAVIEKVGGFIRRPGEQRGNPGSRMFEFGKNVGHLEAFAMAHGMRVEYVHPGKWQKHFGLGARNACKSDSEWKNKLKACAQRLYPGTKVTLATADALLILDWARVNVGKSKEQL